MKALLQDIEEVHREDSFAKFVIFSQYPESLAAVSEMFEVESIRLSHTSAGNLLYRCFIN